MSRNKYIGSHQVCQPIFPPFAPGDRGGGRGSLGGDHIVVHRLSAGQQAHLGLRAGGGEEGLRLLGLLLGGLVVFMHRGNISRLLHGTENKFSLHHKKE